MKHKKQLMAGMLLAAVCLMVSGCKKEKPLFAEQRDEVIVIIDEKQDITLGDLAFYIYNSEQTVQAQAIAYNKDDPNEYWRLYTNGRFIKLVAMDGCLETAIRDYLLAMEAEEHNFSLSEEGEKEAELLAETTLNGMTKEQIKRTGMTEEAAVKAMQRAVLARDYAGHLIIAKGLSEDAYNIGQIQYDALRDKHRIVIDEEKWEAVEFGHITLNY